MGCAKLFVNPYQILNSQGLKNSAKQEVTNKSYPNLLIPADFFIFETD